MCGPLRVGAFARVRIVGCFFFTPWSLSANEYGVLSSAIEVCGSYMRNCDVCASSVPGSPSEGLHVIIGFRFFLVGSLTCRTLRCRLRILSRYQSINRMLSSFDFSEIPPPPPPRPVASCGAPPPQPYCPMQHRRALMHLFPRSCLRSQATAQQRCLSLHGWQGRSIQPAASRLTPLPSSLLHPSEIIEAVAWSACTVDLTARSYKLCFTSRGAANPRKLKG